MNVRSILPSSWTETGDGQKPRECREITARTGSKNVERICEEAWRMGIKYLTVYAFPQRIGTGRKVKSAR